MVEILVVTNIRRADQVLVVPRNDKKRSAIGRRLDIESVLRRTRELAHDNVAALGATDQTLGRCRSSLEYAVNPWARCIDDGVHTYFRAVLASVSSKLSDCTATAQPRYRVTSQCVRISAPADLAASRFSSTSRSAKVTCAS